MRRDLITVTAFFAVVALTLSLPQSQGIGRFSSVENGQQSAGAVVLFTTDEETQKSVHPLNRSIAVLQRCFDANSEHTKFGLALNDLLIELAAKLGTGLYQVFQVTAVYGPRPPCAAFWFSYYVKRGP